LYSLAINNHTRINHQITAKELLVIDDGGESLGVLPLPEALRIAKEKGLDLIEIAPTATPPVGKITSYDKYRYQQEKKLKKQKSQQKDQETKEVQISVKEALNDMKNKVIRIDEFFTKGHPVQIVLVMRGREKANKDFAMRKLDEFLKMVNNYRIISDKKFGGKGIIVQIQKR